MADRERESAVEGAGDREPGSLDHTAAADPGACPDCDCTQLTLIRDSALVSVYKCPNCGHLAAPVKRP